MYRIQQVGFTLPIVAAYANDAFCKRKLLLKVIFKLKQRYGINAQNQDAKDKIYEMQLRGKPAEFCLSI